MQTTMPLNTMRTLPGTPYPLAALYDGSGTNFAVFSEVAERIDLCLFEEDGRKPRASVNFITAHDGFTLHDLVTYEQEHNEDNLENNQDGTDDNRPWQIVLNTSTRLGNGQEGDKPSDSLRVKAEGRSVIVLTRPRK